MEKGVAYKVDAFFNNCCVRNSNDKVIFVTNGDLYDQLNKIKLDYSLYTFINKDVRLTDELVADYVIYFSYGKFVIIV